MNDNAIALMAGLLKWPEEKILQALAVNDQYKTFKRRKKKGSYRTICAPHPLLKKLQRRLLHYFLYRIPIGHYYTIHGSRPQRSAITNAKEHLCANTRFVLRLDLRNAFPSVKKDFLVAIFQKIFLGEIAKYATWEKIAKYVKGTHSWQVIFSPRRVRWFRNLFKEPRQLNLFYDHPQKIIEDFAQLLLQLTTYKAQLPQGSPASPHLLNVALVYSGLIEKIRAFLETNKVFVGNSDDSIAFTIYVDDFTVSACKPINWKTIQDLIKLIERESPFKVNRDKILYFQRDRVAPLVTGLRLVRLKKSRHDLVNSLMRDSSITPRQKEKILSRALNEKGEWHVETIRLPKRQIRKIRGLIYQACLPEFREKLTNKVEGYIPYLQTIYGDELPRQVAKPWKKYQSLKQ